MSYFKTSFATLERLATKGRFEYVAAFLVIARHCSGRAEAGFAPYSFTGAGRDAIKRKVGLSDERARGVFEELKQDGILAPLPPGAKKSNPALQWQVNQAALDLELPHEFVDGLKNNKTVTPPIKRFRGPISSPQTPIEGLSDTERALDALMLMLNFYKESKMQAFGGVDPRCFRRPWSILSIVQHENGFQWGAEPQGETSVTTYAHFMRQVLSHRKDPSAPLTKEEEHRFWNAWYVLREAGLVYECVSLFDADPNDNPLAATLCPLRINDFHAGVNGKDPSLLAEFEAYGESTLGFYTPQNNSRSESEAMRVVLPHKTGTLIGIWRARFRARTPDVGAWLEQEKQTVDMLFSSLQGA